MMYVVYTCIAVIVIFLRSIVTKVEEGAYYFPPRRGEGEEEVFDVEEEIVEHTKQVWPHSS